MAVRARRFCGGVFAAVAAVILGSAITLPASAADEYGSADTCAAAPDLGEWTSMSGSVHNSWDLTDWYGHSSRANQRTITLDMGPDGLDLQVWSGDCTTVRCPPSTLPGTTQERCQITGAGLVKIRVVFPTPGAGFGYSNYTLRVELPPQCQDGYDNDGDNLADYPLDVDCTDVNDPDEAGPVPPACNDRVDNDGDGRIDYPLDQGCSSATDTDEDNAASPACNDGADNDGDGRADYPLDPGCASLDDTDEDNVAGPCNPTAPGVIACLTPGGVYLSQPVALVSAQPTNGHHVVGYVGRYTFTLPLDIQVTLPCVVVTLDASPDPCAGAGGAFVDRIATLVDTTAYEYTVTPGAPIATARVCHATLTATVLGLGINSAPAYTLC